jgi:hypothetical protein
VSVGRGLHGGRMVSHLGQVDNEQPLTVFGSRPVVSRLTSLSPQRGEGPRVRGESNKERPNGEIAIANRALSIARFK